MCLEAIESGHLPGDILDDIPVKYVDGALICEVRDYRRCSPAVSKSSLKMSLENIVKDIPSHTDKSWKYGDVMEVESKIVKELHPNLHLDPTPKLDQLCQSPLQKKPNLQIKRPRNAVTSSNKIDGEKVRIDRVLENSKSRLGDSRITTSNAIVKQTLENPAMQNLNPSIAMRSKNIVLDSSIPGFSMISHQSKYPMAVGTPRSLQERRLIAGINSSGASAVQDVMYSYADNPNLSATLLVKRENPDRESPSLSNIAKRMRSASTGVDTMQQIDSHVNALQGSDMNWQDTLLQQQAMARGIQYTGSGIQMFPQQVFEGGLNQQSGGTQFASSQQGMRLVAKAQQFDTERIDGAGIKCNLDPQQVRLQQRMAQHASMRPNFPQTTSNSPQLSNGILPHSLMLLSSKSGEFSKGSVGLSSRPSSMKNASGALQKKKDATYSRKKKEEKTAMASHTAAVGTPSTKATTDTPSCKMDNLIPFPRPQQ
ncbi:DNA-binding protein, putative [Medicago truncatula]|uniref:DNA-binding protein, putative n=2 Tax=Medicago truncatula TaxID=3880 RepID=A0A072U6F8_MEDTR|nr:DNA-binding protein, putative [Medicago truncatula]